MRFFGIDRSLNIRKKGKQDRELNKRIQLYLLSSAPRNAMIGVKDYESFSWRVVLLLVVKLQVAEIREMLSIFCLSFLQLFEKGCQVLGFELS